MSVGSFQPGMKSFLNIFTVILVLVLIIKFLSYMDSLERDIELVSIDKQVSDINASLALTLYNYVAKGKLSDLQEFNLDNPFVFLAANHQLPLNYFGVIKDESEISQQGGWYFEGNNRLIIYQSAYDLGRFYYQLKFIYRDINESGRYELGEDRLESFRVEKLKKPPVSLVDTEGLN